MKIGVIGITAGGLEYPAMNLAMKDGFVQQDGRRVFESLQEAAAFITKYPKEESERLGIIHWQFSFE